MPLVEVEFIGKTESQTASFARPIADKLGQIFESPTAGTWVRIRHTPPTHYAENQSGNPRGAHAAFVTITVRDLPEQPVLKTQAHQVAAAIGGVSGVAAAQVHVIFQPPVTGRIAFGGELT